MTPNRSAFVAYESAKWCALVGGAFEAGFFAIALCSTTSFALGLGAVPTSFWLWRLFVFAGTAGLMLWALAVILAVAGACIDYWSNENG